MASSRIGRRTIPAYFLRGGTSKGVFFKGEDLPKDQAERNRLLERVMGVPDATGMQLDGLGGGISSTSKVVIIDNSAKAGMDIDYTFGQVPLRQGAIDWSANCGNLASAAGLLAVDHYLEGRCKDGDAEVVNIWQTNVQQHLRVHVYGKSAEKIHIPGVPGSGSPIFVELVRPSMGGLPLFPSGNVVTDLDIGSRKVTATCLCCANPTVFIKPCDLGLQGSELPSEIDYASIKEDIEQIGGAGASAMGIAHTSALRVCWVSPPTDYTTSSGESIAASDVDITSRITTEGRVHHAHTGTGAFNLALAVLAVGSVPNQVLSNALQQKDGYSELKIGHPGGVLAVQAAAERSSSSGEWKAVGAGMLRTARYIMTGVAHVD